MAKLEEKASVVTSQERNTGRGIGAFEKRPRKAMGAKIDILFSDGCNELGACEVGKSDVLSIDDKYINDGLLKIPKTLKDILSVQVQANPSCINNLNATGYLIMGIHMELIIMSIPRGKHVARVQKTKRFPFPSSPEGLHTEFLSLLELAWKGWKMMDESRTALLKRRRDNVEL